MSISRWVPTAALVVLGACSPGADSVPAAEVVDSAGTRIVAYDLTGLDIPPFATVGEHDLGIGVLDGPPEYTLSQVTDMTVLDDGSIVVADSGPTSLRVYDAHGVHLRTIGRQGDGPGEFGGTPRIAGIAADTLFIWDSRNRRVTTFTAAGDLLEMATFQSEDAGRPLILTRLDDGTFLSQSRWIAPGADPYEAYDMRVDVDSIAVELLDPSGALLDTIRVLQDQERIRRVQVRDGGIFNVQQMPRPISPRVFVRSDGSRSIIGHGSVFEIVMDDRDTGQRALLRVEGAWPSLTTEAMRARVEEQLVEASDQGELDPAIRRVYEEYLPDRTPDFGDLVIGRDGDLWVAPYELDLSTEREWLVFSPEGELRGSVTTPSRLRVFVSGPDFVAGVVLDEFDVPYVRRYPLLPTTP